MLKALQNCDSPTYEDMHCSFMQILHVHQLYRDCPSYKDIYTKRLFIDRVYKK